MNAQLFCRSRIASAKVSTSTRESRCTCATSSGPAESPSVSRKVSNAPAMSRAYAGPGVEVVARRRDAEIAAQPRHNYPSPMTLRIPYSATVRDRCAGRNEAEPAVLIAAVGIEFAVGRLLHKGGSAEAQGQAACSQPQVAEELHDPE